MIYLSKVTLPKEKPQRWPFTVPSINAMDELSFNTPVTFIAGDNGTGKSTLMEALAIKLRLPSIGRVDASRDESLKSLRPLASAMKQTFSHKPLRKFFLRSEDFFNFVLKLNNEKQELEQELRRVEVEYKDRDKFAQNQARAAYAGSLHSMKATYGEDLLNEASHGESFMRLFEERILPKGLYLLDEPEVPLSPLRQLSLLSMIKDMSINYDCQFIIATHSPILLAYPDTTIYSMDIAPPEKMQWDDLESVQLMMDFFRDPQNYIRYL
jgi:predicted ATPase